MDGVPDETQEEAGAWVARYTEAATRLGLVAAQKERRAAEEALLDAAEAMTRGLGSAEALHGFLAARTHQNLRYRRELLALAMRAPLRA